MGMTMKRTEKTEALAKAKPEADGYTKVEFASPKLRAAAKTERGHLRMTPAEYAALRLGRGTTSGAVARDNFAAASRYPRQVTRRG